MSDAFSSSCHDSTNCSVAGGHAVTKSVKSQHPTSSFDIASTHEFHENLHTGDRPQEECGVFGIFAPGIDVARRAFFGIFALQHRGQESAGIAVSNVEKMQLHTDMGLVTQIF